MPDRPATTIPSGTGGGALALTLQEAFTVAVRLRANRQVAADPGAFRAHVKQLLTAVDRDARAWGYDGDSIRMAVYAYVAFLDESVLGAAQPMFSQWSQQPLQEEVFGDHVAGENFFRYLAELLGRQDAEALADLLEVYLLCLLLGFRGKYAANPAGLQSVIGMVRDKIHRIRGGAPPIAPSWAPPASEHVAVEGDPWLRRLAIGLVGGLLVTIAGYAILALVLNGSVGELRELSASLIR
jgi:type VI secretion system protein ImpK